MAKSIKFESVRKFMEWVLSEGLEISSMVAEDAGWEIILGSEEQIVKVS